ncbi:Rrf2 family transcriptional regulator [Zooshikella ganghwensis]|uniref:Rrf2 family transcriptional regulator n=1 Tax=Zooshikella ganghwensis TaxID=202772 RepID=UPI000410A6BB|nr:Rrf2 family transcriptional regulator [Zooshikella ganghwensis]
MKLTQYTDYGLRTLIYLTTLPPDTLSNVGDVAARYAISRNHLVKVVNQLTRLGYICSVRGKGGGIRLAKKPTDIILGAVIRALEGNLQAVECHALRCKLVEHCALQQALATAMDAFLQVMDGYTLADITQNKTELVQLLTLPP